MAFTTKKWHFLTCELLEISRFIHISVEG